MTFEPPVPFSGRVDGHAPTTGPTASALTSPWRQAACLGLCAILAVVLSGTAGFLAMRSSRAYYATAMHHHDSAPYRYAAFQFYQKYHNEGLRSALKMALEQKDSFDIVVRLLLAPSTLVRFFGHLAVALPFLALFLFLLIWYVHRRTDSILLGVAIASFLFALPILYHPITGLADYWKDNLSTWLLSSAALTWLLSKEMTLRRWSMLSGLLLGVLVMQRSAVAVYAAVLFLVPFLVAFRRRCAGSRWKTIVADVGAFVAPAALLGGIVAVLQGEMLYDYYFHVGYAYGTPTSVFQHLASIGLQLLKGRECLVGTLATISALGIVCLTQDRQQTRDVLTALYWCAGLLTCVGLTSTLFHGIVAVWLPLLLVFIATCLPARLTPVLRGAFAVALIYVATQCSAREYETNREFGQVLAQGNAAKGRFFDQLGDLLAHQSQPRKFALFFDECEPLIWSQAYFRRGQVVTSEQYYFSSVHDSYYRSSYGNRAAAEIAAEVLAKVERDAAYVVAAYDLSDLKQNAGFDNHDPEKSLALRIQLAQIRYLRQSPHWRGEQVFLVPGYGTLIAYSYSPQPLSEREKWSGIKFASQGPDNPLAIQGAPGVGVLHYCSTYAPERGEEVPLQWLPGGEVGLSLRLLSDAARPVIFHARATAGPASKNSDRTLIIKDEEKTSTCVLTGGSDEIWAKINLRAGFNEIKFTVVNPEDGTPPPVGDKRSMMLLLAAPTLICPGPDGKLPERSFEGFEAVEGIGPAEGPFPKWNLDIIHWGKGAQSRLKVRSHGGPVRLFLDCKTDLAGQAMEVLLDGASVTASPLPLGVEFTRFDVPLEIPAGEHEVTIRYLVPAPTPNGLTVLYRKIRFVSDIGDPRSHNAARHAEAGEALEASIKSEPSTNHGAGTTIDH
jgi:hypothetical protein